MVHHEKIKFTIVLVLLPTTAQNTSQVPYGSKLNVIEEIDKHKFK